MEDEDPFFPLFAKQDPSGFEYELPKENEEESSFPIHSDHQTRVTRRRHRRRRLQRFHSRFQSQNDDAVFPPQAGCGRQEDQQVGLSLPRARTPEGRAEGPSSWLHG